MIQRKTCLFIGFGCYIGICVLYQTGVLNKSYSSIYHQMLGDATFMLGVNHSAIIRYDKTNNKDRLVLSILRQGRLGNGMYEYSALLGLANITNRIPLLNRGFRDMTKLFTLSTPIDTRITRTKHFPHYYQRQLYINVEETAQNLRNMSKNVTLVGYFQYFRFFSSVSKKIRKEFQFRVNIKQQVSTFFNTINVTDNKITKVGIHIRRTDLNKPRPIELGFGPPPTNYFLNAMEFFRRKYENVHFVVCSDDIKWARKHLLGDDITFATNHTGALDMAILASCDHVIVGNGSFSWWVGWLCTGSTVRYKWMPKYDSHLYNFTRGEYWPPNDTYNHYIAIDSD